MSKRVAFWIFLLGTVFSALLFLGLTVDTHRQVAALSHADRLSEQVVAGKRAFEKYNCNDCHTILGFGGYYAPDLTKVVQRVGGDGVRYRVASPELAFARSLRKMPQQHVSAAEIEDLVAFFAWVGAIDNGDWPPQDRKTALTRSEERLAVGAAVSPGAAVFQSRGCMNCHALGGVGGSFGPPLDTVGGKLSVEQLRRYIRDPRSVNPQARMPAQDGLSPRELDEVATFLGNLR